jgi:hypothetical protein
MPAALNEEACDEEKATDAGNKIAHTLIHNSVQILAKTLRLHPCGDERLRLNRARHEE